MGESVTLSGALAGLESQAVAYSSPSINPSPAAMQVLNQLSEGNLSRDQVSALAAAVAQADAGIQNAELRQSVLNEVSGLGMYFRTTNSEGFPRWPVMTALRAYGLNLSVPKGEADAAVAAQVRQTLSNVAQKNYGGGGVATHQQAAAAVAQPVVLKVVAPKAPVKSEAPVTSAVDKLV